MQTPYMAPIVSAERLIHINHFGGHHKAYADLFERIFGLKLSLGTIDRARGKTLVASQQLFFGTIDDDIAGFTHIALRRAMRGQQTAGIFMQPQSCFTTSWHSRMKRLYFSIISRIPYVSVLSIVPFPALPAIQKVATGWMHDPQLWDLVDSIADAAPVDRTTHFTKLANGRPMLAFVGTVSENKGIVHLADILSADPTLTQRLFVIVAGQVTENAKGAMTKIRAAGGTILDERISDADLAALYNASAAIWACYHPLFDQASGIFGRAVQFGRRPVIRDGARVMGYYADLLDVNPVRLPEDPVAAAAVLVEALCATAPAVPDLTETLRGWRADFIATVRRSLGAGHSGVLS